MTIEEMKDYFSHRELGLQEAAVLCRILKVALVLLNFGSHSFIEVAEVIRDHNRPLSPNGLYDLPLG